LKPYIYFYQGYTDVGYLSSKFKLKGEGYSLIEIIMTYIDQYDNEKIIHYFDYKIYNEWDLYSNEIGLFYKGNIIT